MYGRKVIDVVSLLALAVFVMILVSLHSSLMVQALRTAGFLIVPVGVQLWYRGVSTLARAMNDDSDLTLTLTDLAHGDHDLSMVAFTVVMVGVAVLSFSMAGSHSVFTSGIIYSIGSFSLSLAGLVAWGVIQSYRYAPYLPLLDDLEAELNEVMDPVEG